MSRQNTVADFWKFVKKGPKCWVWSGAIRGHGYGVFSFRSKNWQAHRFSFQLKYGPIADGLHVCHKCDNPPCVRPDHLFVGTQTDNRRDFSKKHRAAGLHRAKMFPVKFDEKELHDMKMRAAQRDMNASTYIRWLVRKDK